MKLWDSLISSLISSNTLLPNIIRRYVVVKNTPYLLFVSYLSHFIFPVGKIFFLVGKVNNISCKEFCPYLQLPPRLSLLSLLSNVKDPCNQGRNGNALMNCQYRYTHYHYSQLALRQTPFSQVLHQQTSLKNCCMMPSG